MGVDKKYLKFILVILLILQTTLVLDTARVCFKKNNDVKRSQQSALIICEFVKLIFSLIALLVNDGIHQTVSQIVDKTQLLKVGIPGLIYGLQNCLVMLALSLLPSGLYHSVYQLKLVTTAILSYFILGRYITRQQFFSLFIVTFGAIGVTYVNNPNNPNETHSKSYKDFFIGVTTVIVATLTSATAGNTLELFMKNASVSIWARNIHLAVYGLFFNLIWAYNSDDWDFIITEGFFSGWDVNMWLLIIYQGLGGLLIALVLKYVGNIEKCMANTIAILFTSFLSIYRKDLQFKLSFMFYALITISGVILYSIPIHEIITIKSNTNSLDNIALSKC